MNDYSYELLDLLKKYENDTNAALAGESDPWCLYAFSPLRENLFEWVELEAGARVLQIGSDYGSYTGLLAKCAAEVVVLDTRDENLEVNRLRHGEKGNVRFVCRNSFGAGSVTDGTGSVTPMYREYKPQADAQGTVDEVMGRLFDYVFIAGVFEQLEKKEAEVVLELAAGFLKPGGTLLAAAENEMGVRYLMGAELPGTAFLETEFRGLFEHLKERHGGEYTMYYPLPDYRYPATTYSDFYLPKAGEVTNISARYEEPGFQFGSEEEAMAKACQNGQFTKLTNSFLAMYRKG